MTNDHYYYDDINNGDKTMTEKKESGKKPGVCIPWQERMKELPEITGDKELIKKKWEDIDELGYVYIWHCLLSF